MSGSTIIKLSAGSISGVFAYFYGGLDALFVALVCAVVIDYITGVISAAVSGTLSSKTGFVGLFKKFLIFMIVALAGVVDKIIPATNDAVRSAVCMFYVANEALSILENAGELGLPLPSVLTRAVLRLHDDSSEE